MSAHDKAEMKDQMSRMFARATSITPGSATVTRFDTNWGELSRLFGQDGDGLAGEEFFFAIIQIYPERKACTVGTHRCGPTLR